MAFDLTAGEFDIDDTDKSKSTGVFIPLPSSPSTVKAS